MEITNISPDYPFQKHRGSATEFSPQILPCNTLIMTFMQKVASYENERPLFQTIALQGVFRRLYTPRLVALRLLMSSRGGIVGICNGCLYCQPPFF